MAENGHQLSVQSLRRESPGPGESWARCLRSTPRSERPDELLLPDTWAVGKRKATNRSHQPDAVVGPPTGSWWSDRSPTPSENVRSHSNLALHSASEGYFNFLDITQLTMPYSQLRRQAATPMTGTIPYQEHQHISRYQNSSYHRGADCVCWRVHRLVTEA